MILLFLPMVFASSGEVKCDDGSEVDWNQKEIPVGEAKSVNGLRVGVSNADEIAVSGKISADLIIDAVDVALSKSNNVSNVELSDGEHTIVLINATSSEMAHVAVDGTYKLIANEDADEIDGYIVLMTKLQTDGGNTPSANILLGDYETRLTNDENPMEEITLDGVSYVLELFSASDSNAILRASKCLTGEIFIEAQVEEPVVNVTQNVSDEEEINDSVVEDVNVTQNVSDEDVIDVTIESGDVEGEEKVGLWVWILLGAIVVLIVGGIVGYFVRKKRLEKSFVDVQ